MITTRHINSATAPLTVDGVLNSLLSVQSPEKNMADDVPRFTALEIGDAYAHLKNATEGACQIECLQIYAPDTTVRFKTKMLLSAMKAAAFSLGYRLEPMAGPHIVVNNEDNVTGMSR